MASPGSRTDAALHSHSPGRRRLLKGAVATTAFIATVANRPALGGPCTVSGALSGNLSHQHDDQFCGGRSPGYWKNRLNDEITTFVAVFGDVWRGMSGPWDPGVTLYEVLHMDGTEDRYEFGMHATAAYLSAVNFSDYPMDPSEVVTIVQAVLPPGGLYTDPASGQTLDVIEVRDFFFGTFDAD